MWARDAPCRALVEELRVVGVPRGTHGEHEEPDEIVAEDDGGE